MHPTQIIGAAMLAAPFVALFIYAGVALKDWRAPLIIFSAVAGLVVFVGAGAYLLTGGQ